MIKCFDFFRENNKVCRKKKCKYYINSKCDSNCAIVSAKKGPKTLQEIGEIFGVTRMRICQIEKRVIKKIKKQFEELDIY